MTNPEMPVDHRLAILAVDDDPFMTNLIRLYGEKLGCDVHELNESRNIGKALLAHDADVIFLDIVMPGKDGVEVINELRKYECKAAIVLMSGLDRRRIGSVASLVNNTELEFIGSISKPFTFSQVSELLKIVIQKKVEIPSPQSALNADEIPFHGPQLLFEPEVTLAGASADSVSGFNVQLVWVDDACRPVKLPSLLSERVLPSIGKGVLSLYIKGLKEIASSASDRYNSLQFKLPLTKGLIDKSQTPDFLDYLMCDASIKPSALTLIIDETELLEMSDTAIDVLNRISIKGFRVAARLSSEQEQVLGLVKSLPVDELMIDMKVVKARKLPQSELEYVLGSLVSHARKLSIETVAEQISNDQSLELAKRCSFTKVRGPYIGSPMSFDETMGFAYSKAV